MVDARDWSTVPGNNGTVDGINIAEGCPAANINGGLRAMMAGTKTALNAVPNTDTLAPKDSPVFTGVTPRYQGRGGFVHFNSPGMVYCRIIPQPAGSPIPGGLGDGDQIWEY